MLHDPKEITAIQHALARGKSFPTVRQPAVNPLTLPRLQKDVNTSVLLGNGGRRWAQIALLWLQEITHIHEEAPDLFDKHKGNAQALTHMAIERWVSSHLDGLEHLYLNFLITPSHIGQWGYSISEEMGPDDWGLVFYPPNGHGQKFLVGETLKALETAHPGLGETVLDAIEKMGFGTANLYSPLIGKAQAEHLFWYGTDEDSELREEYLASENEDESSFKEFAESIVMPSEYKAYYPEWVLNSKEKLDIEELERIATQSDMALAREIATTLSQYKKTCDPEITQVDLACTDNGCGDECMYFGAILAMDEEDPALRVLDDFDNMVYTSGDGFVEEYGIAIAPVDPQGFQKWKLQMEQSFKDIRTLDRLLSLVAGVKNSKE